MTTLPTNPPSPSGSTTNFGPLITALATLATPFVAKYMGVTSDTGQIVAAAIIGGIFHWAEQRITSPPAIPPIRTPLVLLIACAGLASLIGCQNLTTPSTQPTEAGVLSVTAMYQAISATEQTQLSFYAAGTITKAQLQAELPIDQEAMAAADAAKAAALAGDSAAQGLAATATVLVKKAQATTQPTN